MSTQPIVWHERCLKSHQRFVDDKRKQIEGLQIELAWEERQIAFYSGQISAAKKKKMVGFDQERFMVKRSI